MTNESGFFDLTYCTRYALTKDLKSSSEKSPSSAELIVDKRRPTRTDWTMKRISKYNSSNGKKSTPRLDHEKIFKIQFFKRKKKILSPRLDHKKDFKIQFFKCKKK